MMKVNRTLSVLALSAALAGPGWTQDTQEGVSEQDAAAALESATAEGALLTDEELQTLVGPIALYPDTLLIQVLVAATVPVDVLKADRFLLENADVDPAELAPQIEEQDWDESVAVLASGFPDLIGGMAKNIEWTESLGTAMLAQTDDVMRAVQDLRALAQENGTIQSDENVEVTQDEAENIVIVPTDPEVIYVPTYDSGYDWGSAFTTGVVVWGTFWVLDNIFDDNDYWGCRNCAGWGGRPIYNNPNIDIDIDGDVIIGNRPGGGDGSWRPRPEKRQEARNAIAERRDGTGRTKLPLERPTQSDDLRQRLSERSGAPDISRPEVRDRLPQVGNGNTPNAEALRERSQQGRDIAKPDRARAPVRKPDVQRSAPARRPAAQPAARPTPNLSRAPAAKKAAGAKARASSARGGRVGGGGGPRRR